MELWPPDRWDRNRDSSTQLFDRVLRQHQRLYDVSKPLMRAGYRHALDVWQWVLRLNPKASLTLQLAALFHDVARLRTAVDLRVDSFDDADEKCSADIAREALAEAEVPEEVRNRVAEIVAAHERQSNDDEVALLNDAGALSFFALNSSAYVDDFGPEAARSRIADTWRRMRASARAKLEQVFLRQDVRAMLEE
ncbi:MAG TPA: DUF4202 family protein [Thermoanaerobaculia bacterium]|nr:DUF4202 family protein [Thermoanaerobaculia bacterium]